jgi:hypothetical protein
VHLLQHENNILTLNVVVGSKNAIPPAISAHVSIDCPRLYELSIVDANDIDSFDQDVM